jgi:hypothetical protein
MNVAFSLDADLAEEDNLLKNELEGLVERTYSVWIEKTTLR